MDRHVTDKDVLHKKYLDILSTVKSKILPGYDLGLVLYNEAWYAIEKRKSIYKELLKSMPIRPCSFDVKIIGQDLLTIATFLGRPDHDSYWNAICDDAGNHDNITLLYPKDAKSFIKNVDILGVSIRLHWFNLFFKELEGIKPFRNRVYLTLQLVKRKWVLSEIESMNLSHRLVMCFFDGNPDESLLMLYFKKNGAITVTNQHGQPLFRSFDYDRLNQSQILGFKCDCFLAKGEFTRRQFAAAGVDQERILLLGVVGDRNNHNDLQTSRKSYPVIGLLLDSPTLPFSNEVNSKIISITQNVAHKLNGKFFIRIHPLDTADNYSYNVGDAHCLGIYDNRIPLDKLLLLCDVTVIHATASYLDSYKNRVRAFKYKSDVYFPIAKEEDEFKTEDELFALINSWIMEDSNTKEKYMDRVYSDYNSGWYPNKTQDILNQLIK